MKRLIYILIGWTMISCQDLENCGTNEDRDFLIIRFFDRESKEPKAVGFRFTVDGSPFQWVFDADTTITPADTTTTNGETVITPADTTIVSDSTFILLPIDPLKTSTTYFFESDTTSDVLEIGYEQQIKIFDPACDPSFTYVNLDTLRHSFDSLSLPGTVTNIQIATNVEIYL